MRGLPDKVAVRCYQGKADGIPLIECAVVGGKVEPIDWLAVGDYEVRLEHGERYREAARVIRGAYSAAL